MDDPTIYAIIALGCFIIMAVGVLMLGASIAAIMLQSSPDDWWSGE